jgi:hypothetical protein
MKDRRAFRLALASMLGAFCLAPGASAGVQAGPIVQAERPEEPVDAEAAFQALADQPADLSELPGLEVSQAMVDQILGQIISTEIVPDWRTAGVDIFARLRERPGGLTGNVLVAEDPDPNITGASYFADRELPDVTPQSWALVATYGRPVTGERTQMDIVSYSRALKVVSSWRPIMIGTAHCAQADEGELRVYRDRSAPVTEEDLGMLVILATLTRITVNSEMCTYYEAQGDRLISRLVTRDGRRVLGMLTDTLRNRVAPISESPFPGR